MTGKHEEAPAAERRGVRRDWEDRQRQHGNEPRAVLMKGLHPLINEAIDAWHRDVVRTVFEDGLTLNSGALLLDVGCGFGRLANEITRLGHTPLGIDFTLGFCMDFADRHGDAVCGDQAVLPFRDAIFAGAYSVTSLMYLDRSTVRLALEEIDRCLAPGGIALVLEPSREFNDLVRTLLPGKRSEQLAMPGFCKREFGELLPSSWRMVDTGNCRWLTYALPLLVATARWPLICRYIARQARRLDGKRSPPSEESGIRLKGGLAMYRWIACRKVK